jgi:hypothetical protein
MLNFRKKTPKGEMPDKNLFTIFNPHTRDLNERQWTQGYYQVVSIDPSVKNMGFRIERRYPDGRIVPLAYTRRNFFVAAPVDDAGKPVVEASMVYETYELVTRFLDEFESMFQESHIIIIERQMPQNYKAVRFSQHIISYFTLKLKNTPLLPIIVEVDNKLKSRQLGAPRGIGERQVKMWLIEKAKELLQMRQDTWSFNLLTKERKKDDLADVICQVEAFFSYMGLPVTVPVSTTPKTSRLAIVTAPPVTTNLAPSAETSTVEVGSSTIVTPPLNNPDPNPSTTEPASIPDPNSNPKTSTAPATPVQSAKPKGRRRNTKEVKV